MQQRTKQSSRFMCAYCLNCRLCESTHWSAQIAQSVCRLECGLHCWRIELQFRDTAMSFVKDKNGKIFTVDAMNAYRESESLPPPILSLGTGWSWLVNFTPRSLYTRELIFSKSSRPSLGPTQHPVQWILEHHASCVNCGCVKIHTFCFILYIVAII
jgi:hypothetical protein